MAIFKESHGNDYYYYDAGHSESLKVAKPHHSFRTLLKSAFLPQGYPNSVSSDYLEYQKWDTFQAFCSSITNTLSSHALLRGFGVGNASATVGAALYVTMFRDGSAMLGRILFAWTYGTNLDCNSRFWRLFADVLNDIAICVEIIAPSFPDYFVYLVCAGSLGKAIVSVAGGATRAALTQHQAINNNMADVSAKDGSQEQLVQLLAMFCGFLLTPVMENPNFVWILFTIFTLLHIFSNYRAVSAIIMNTFNKDRAWIQFDNYYRTKVVLSPEEVAQKDTPLKNVSKNLRNKSKLSVHQGCRLADFAKASSIDKVIEPFHNRNYEITFVSIRGKLNAYVIFHNLVSREEVLKSFFHCCFLELEHPNEVPSFVAVSESHVKFDKIWKTFSKQLLCQEWVIHKSLLGEDDWRIEAKKKAE